MSRRVFLSYCRTDSQRVQRLADDVRALGYSPWLDQEIGGGQAWWDEILRQIRATDIFVVALSAAALESVPCLREYEYATALGKPILPIGVNADVTPALLPPALAALQIVTWKPDDAHAALRLSRAFMNLPAAAAAPTIEPTPPAVPLSYLTTLHERVTTSQDLSLKEQSALLLELKQRVRAGKDRDDLRALMLLMRARPDLYASVAEELDEVLQERSQPAAAASSTQEPAPIESGVQPEVLFRGPKTAAVASSGVHASLSPIETSITTGKTWRKQKRLILLSAAACILLGGIGVLAYVLQSPREKPPSTVASPPAVAATLEPERSKDLRAPSAGDNPIETATAPAPPGESLQPIAAPSEAGSTAAIPKKHKTRQAADVEPKPRGLSAKAVGVVHSWKVTAKQDCEPGSVRPPGCNTAENATANLDKNATATWAGCSCTLNAAARNAIETAADFIR